MSYIFNEVLTISTGVGVGGTPISGGTDTSILFQRGGFLSEDPNFNWNYTTRFMTITGGGVPIIIGRPLNVPTYNIVSLNNNQVTTTNVGLAGGGPGDNTLYLESTTTGGGTEGFTFQVDGTGIVGVTTSAINLVSAMALSWNSDTGISRDSADVIDFGNGTQGDISATVQFTRANLFGLTTFTTTKNSIISTYRYNNSIDLGGGFGSGTAPNISFNLNGGFGGGGDLLIIAAFNLFNASDIAFNIQVPGSGWTVFEHGGGSGGLSLGCANNLPVVIYPGRVLTGTFTGSGTAATPNGVFSLYNATDSAVSPVNYERGILGWLSNILTIGAQKNGSGTLRAVQLIGASITAQNCSLSVAADTGGIASTNTVSSANSTTISTGTGTVKMSSANNANNTGWLKCYIGTQVAWIPCWTSNAP